MSNGRTRVGQAWSEEDDAELRRLVSARQPAGVIASALGRTVDAIRGRAAGLRLALPSSRRPWRQFPGKIARQAVADVEPLTDKLGPITDQPAKLNGSGDARGLSTDRSDEGKQDG